MTEENGESHDESSDGASTEEAPIESAAPDSDEPAAPAAAAEPTPAPAAAPSKKEKKAAKAAQRPAHVEPESVAGHPHDLPEQTNDEAIASVFTGKGTESVPGDPRRSEHYADELEARATNGTNPKVLAISLGAIVAMCVIFFAVLPGNLKADAIALAGGEDIIQVRRNREEARVAEERRLMLENAPKFGTVQIVTDPNNLFVSSPGQAAMVFPGTRHDLTYPTRTKVTYQDISVTVDFTFTIEGEGNFQDKTVTLPAFGQVDSPWIQSFTGDYTANLTYVVCWPGEPPPVEEKFCIYPVPDRAAELQWRRDWRPDPNETDPEAVIRLPGAITITSDPPGALIAFNGQQLVNTESGEPFRTPHTFSTYNPPADREDQTPLEVYLSREGLPVQLLYEGKAATRFGVYMHQFACNMKPDATPPAPLAPDAPPDTPPPTWLGLCDYSYSVHVALVDEREPEGSGEASGEGSGSGHGAPAPPSNP